MRLQGTDHRIPGLLTVFWKSRVMAGSGELMVYVLLDVSTTLFRLAFGVPLAQSVDLALVRAAVSASRKVHVLSPALVLPSPVSFTV